MSDTGLGVGPVMAMVKPVCGTCNLACEYCYYRDTGSYFGPGPHRMSPDTLRDVVRSFMQVPQRQMSFSWQGGEPLLAGLEFFHRAVAYQHAFARPGQQVSNVLQTNGILLDERWCRFFKRYGFLVGISIDGPPHLHNLHRNDSWQAVVAGLRLLQQHEVMCNVLVLVNPANAGRPREVYQHLRELGVQYMQFIPCVVTGPERDRPSERAVAPQAFGEFLCGIFEQWLAEASPRPYERLLANLMLMAAGLPGELCIYQPQCGGCLLVEYNGDVFPCDFAVQPHWRVGNLRVSPIWRLLEHERMQAFVGLKPRLAQPCRECPWLPYCYGACPLLRFSGDGQAVPSYTCQGLKLFFAHAMPAIQTLARQLPHHPASPQPR